MGLECRLFGEVMKEDVRSFQETIEGIVIEPSERFRRQEIAFVAARSTAESRQFQKTVRLRKKLPIFSFDEEIAASQRDHCLEEWTLRVEGMPLRGMEWLPQFPCIVQEVNSSTCIAAEDGITRLCQLTFQLSHSHTFIHFGTIYHCRRDGFQIEVCLSRISKINAASRSSNASFLSPSHFLVEMTTQPHSSEMKEAAQALYRLYGILQPWMVATVS